MMEGKAGVVGADGAHGLPQTATGDHACSEKSEGWLYKKGRIHKNWKRRWMVLRGAQLYYFTQPYLKDNAAKGFINLEGAEISRPDDASTSELHLAHGSALFLVKTAKGRIYMLKCEQEKSVDVWVQRLQRATQIKALPTEGSRSPDMNAHPKSQSTIVRPTAPTLSTNKPAAKSGAGKGRGLYKRYIGGQDKRGRVFGILLEELVRREDTDLGIPIVIQRIISYLDNVLEVQGIFRVSGGAESVRNLKKAFDQSRDQWTVPLPDDPSGPHLIASLLKLFMKELPEPLIPNDFYKPFLNVQKQQQGEYTLRLRVLRDLIFKMPPSHRAMLTSVTALLRRIGDKSQINQMTPKNLAICLAPNIFRSNDLNLLESMTDAPYLLSIMKTFITQHAYLFDLEEDLELIRPERKSTLVRIPIDKIVALHADSGKITPATATAVATTKAPSQPSADLLGSSDGSGSVNSLVLEVEGFLYDEEILDDPATMQLSGEDLLAAAQAFIEDCQMAE